MKKNVMIKRLSAYIGLLCVISLISCKSSDGINIKGEWNVTHFICGNKYVLPSKVDIPSRNVNFIDTGKGYLDSEKFSFVESKKPLLFFKVNEITKRNDTTYTVTIENCSRNKVFEKFEMVLKEVTTEYDKEFLLNEITATLTSPNSTIILFRPRLVDRKTGKTTQHILYY